MRTRAVRDGDHYVLTGRKLWITNAGVSDFYTVFAKTDPDAGHRGISCFVVEKDFPGLQRLEARAQARRARLTDRRDRARRLRRCPPRTSSAKRAAASHYAMGALDRSRPLVGAQALGIAQGALELATSYVQERQQFGSRHRRLPGPAVHARRHGHAGRRGARCSCTARARCSTTGLPGTGERVVDGEAVRVRHRDAGHDRLRAAARRRSATRKDLPAERFMRDAKITQIYEGTNQIQRIVIAKHLLVT